MARIYLGVDMAKANFVAVVWQAGDLHELGTFRNSAAGFQRLQRQLAPYVAPSPDAVQLVVEPTGGYELRLVYFAHAQGWQVSLPNPRQVRDWAKGTGWRAKTDRQDARLLACFGAATEPPAEQPLPAEVRELDSLLKRRSELEQMLRQERQRLQEGALQPGRAAAVQRNLEQMVKHLQERLAEVEKAIQQHLKAHAHLQRDVRRLRAVPGIGAKNVLPLLVLCYRWYARTAGRGDAKGITAFVGLDPQDYDSGRSVHRPATISKMGDRQVRSLLYMGALGGMRGNNPLAQFYRRLVGRGKPKKLALVAAARKIIVWAWTLFSRQTEWDPALGTAGTA
jgi:transposase